MGKTNVLKKEKKLFMLGNEAVVRGALESGVSVATCYPGTPSSEIGDTFTEIAHDAGMYFEYSTNEKVALDVGIGASLSGLKTMVSFKSFGLNVASDSFLPAFYVESDGPMVIVVTDDPQCWSSVQSEQDTRYFARMANAPLLEPSDPQEALEYTKKAYDISAKYKIPVMLRLTTRVCHTSSPVNVGEVQKPDQKSEFKKDYDRYFTFTPKMIENHDRILDKLASLQKDFEKSSLNYVENDEEQSNFGIITSGVSMCYVREALDNLGIKLPILKLGATYPVPEKNISDFIEDKEEVLVVDELEPMVEGDVRVVASKTNPNLKINGKKLIPRSGELRPEMIEKALSKLLNQKERLNLNDHSEKFKDLDIIRRFPVMCPGCPHRATFFSVKKAAPKDTVFGGDIGCYMLGAFPPYNMSDFMYDMGANIGITHGIRKAADYFGTENAKKNKTISFVGDGTFFHAGISGLLNSVYNNSNTLLVIMDNRITAMTGHQPNPGMGINGMREEFNEVNVEEIVRGCGVKNMKVVSTYNLSETQKAVKELLDVDGPAVLVAKGPCILLRWSEMRKSGKKIIPFEIDQEVCKKCGTCTNQYACPAIQNNDGEYSIDKELCSGCGACSQVCPFKAIKLSKQ